MSTRIYVVRAEGMAPRLVEATNAAQAVRHVARIYTAEVATQRELVELLPSVKVETVSEEA